MDSLLHKFYVFTLKRYDKYPAEYSKGYREGNTTVVRKLYKQIK